MPSQSNLSTMMLTINLSLFLNIVQYIIRIYFIDINYNGWGAGINIGGETSIIFGSVSNSVIWPDVESI